VVVLMAVAMLTPPVMAVPTQGQKAAIILRWSNPTYSSPEVKPSGNVVHMHWQWTWDLELEIDGRPTIYGTAYVDRDLLRVNQKIGERWVALDYCELSFPDEDGGFEGNALIMLTEYDPDSRTWETSKSHGLFQGTGAFEGQTLNCGNHWKPYSAGAPEWLGYIQKP
jgi:hypothetical protein